MIELTLKSDIPHKRIMVNMDKVTDIYETQEGSCISFSMDHFIVVTESLDDIKELL